MKKEQQRTIIGQLNDLAQNICDDYCKYPEQYLTNENGSDDEWEKMVDEKCNDCPLNLISG